MERLTQWLGSSRLGREAGIVHALEEKYTAEELIDILAKRLAAYEDTGLDPEEVKDLQLEVATLKTVEKMYDGIGHPDHLRELAQAEEALGKEEGT